MKKGGRATWKFNTSWAQVPSAQCSHQCWDKRDMGEPRAISAPGQVSQRGSTGHIHPPGADVYIFGELLGMPNIRELLRGTLLPHCSCWWRLLAGHMLTTEMKPRIFPYSLRLRRIRFDTYQSSAWLPKASISYMQYCVLQNVWHLEGPVCGHASHSRSWRLTSRHQDLNIQI